MHTATVDPLVGRTLEGRYRILDRIARGGMSTVYTAVDERLDRYVAVKVMSAALSADPAFSDRFAREARAAARLSHLNTVSVFDQGTDNSNGTHVFLVMELVEGRTLRDLLRERGRLETAEAVSIMEPVLTALSAAHRAGIVHRDVKPENILISDDGVVKVADFGLARAVESDAAATRTGLMMGTVAYCSPEQISKGQADQRSDVYSSGVVFFELLTGAPPYAGESAMNVAYQHVHARVPAPSSKVKGVPSEIDELVVSATDSDPAARPADAAAFLAELSDVRRDLALPVVAVPPRPRTAANGRQHAPSRADGDTTQVVHGGGRDTTVVSRGRPQPTPYPVSQVLQPAQAAQRVPPPPIVTPPPKRRAPSPRMRRRRRNLIVLLVVLLLAVGAGYGGWWFASGRYARVPNVSGQPQSDAIAQLRHAGYEVSASVHHSFNEDVPKGDVISTDPPIGSRVAKGKTVTITVSDGKERFTIASVAGDTVDEARAQLTGKVPEVVLQNATASSMTVPEGKVVGTRPKAGTQVKRGSTITILVSTGPPIIRVPTVAPGTPLHDAEQALQAKGFKTTTVENFDDTIAKNTVISLDPSDEAPQGSTITINVSKGPSEVTIPDIAQLTPVDQARKKLENLGLRVKIEKAFGGKNGLVVGVDPPAGTQVPVGSTVTLSII